VVSVGRWIISWSYEGFDPYKDLHPHDPPFACQWHCPQGSPQSHPFSPGLEAVAGPHES
jgi:hypothetical protein